MHHIVLCGWEKEVFGGGMEYKGDSAGQQGVTGQEEEGVEARKLFSGIQRPTRILNP